MIQCYNHTTINVNSGGADTLIVKGVATDIIQYTAVNGVFVIDLSEYQEGKYILQYMEKNQIIKQDFMTVKQNLKFVSADYDFRTNAEKILEAINAYLSGVATHFQKKIKIGDKEIQYSSYDQLMKWKNYYQSQVDKQQGKKSSIRYEKLYYKG